MPMACVHCALWVCACRPAGKEEGVEERESEREVREGICERKWNRG